MEEIRIKTNKQLEVKDLTGKVKGKIDDIEEGLLTLYVPHTTAAVTIQEGDEELWEDMLETYKRLVPLKRDYKHNAKYSGMSGEQNAHAHILSSMIKPSVHIPIEKGKMALGSWQKILFLELDGGRSRKVKLHVIES